MSSSPICRKPLPNYSRPVEDPLDDDVSPHISIELGEIEDDHDRFMVSDPRTTQDYDEYNNHEGAVTIHAMTSSESMEQINDNISDHSCDHGRDNSDTEPIHAVTSSNSANDVSSIRTSQGKSSGITAQENDIEISEASKTPDSGSIPETTVSIHWTTLVWMITLSLCAVLLAIGHHLYYSRMDKTEVGNTQKQQWPLRIGSAFAFLINSFFAGSAGIAYMQWLWRTLRRKSISMAAIDSAFSAPSSVLSFLNFEMLWQVKLGTLMAIVIWLFPLAAVFTPATLSIEANLKNYTVIGNASILDISDFASSSQNNLVALQRFGLVEVSVGGIYMLTRPSNKMARTAAISSTVEQLLDLDRPVSGVNMSYDVQFNAPLIKCETSTFAVARNTTMAALLSMGPVKNSVPSWNNTIDIDLYNIDLNTLQYNDEFPNSHELTPHIARIGYFAMIPSGTHFLNDNSSAYIAPEVQAPGDMNGEGYGSSFQNELWVVVANHTADSEIQPIYLTCSVWNTSMDITVEFWNDAQTITPNNITYLNTVPQMSAFEPYALNDTVSMSNAAYTSYLWAVSQQITGLYGSMWFNQVTTRYQDAAIQQTYLVGSIEYASMLKNMSSDEIWYEGQQIGTEFETNPSTITELQQSLQDLIEGLSLNTTLNMLADSELSSSMMTNIQKYDTINIYHYNRAPLIITYSIATLLALILVILGTVAMISNWATHDGKASTIVSTMQSSDISTLFKSNTLGAQPLNEHIAKTKLRFGMVHSGDGSHHPGFGIPANVQKLVKNQ